MKIKPLRDIPNRDGFKFIGIDKESKEHYCIVRKKEDGAHVMNSNTALFSDLIGWKHDTPNT